MNEHHDDTAGTLDPDFFENPTTFPGASSRELSPDEVWEWAEPCGPVGSLPRHFGLAEDQVTAIQKRGIRICGQDFTGPYLFPWTTGGDEAPNNMFVRYDRALAARGTLREVELLLENESGVRQVVAVLHRDVDMPDRSSVAEFRQAYANVISGLLEELTDQEDAYRKLEAHEAALEEFYHTRPAGGASRVPLTKPWKDGGGQSPHTQDHRAQQHEEAADAFGSGSQERPVDATQGRTEPRRPEGASAGDALAGMFGSARSTEPTRDPDAHPKHRRRHQ